MQKSIQRLIKETAKKFQVPEQEVEKLYKAQFKLVKQTYESAEKGEEDTFKNIRLIKLGVFYVKEGVKRKLINRKKE